MDGWLDRGITEERNSTRTRDYYKAGGEADEMGMREREESER